MPICFLNMNKQPIRAKLVVYGVSELLNDIDFQEISSEVKCLAGGSLTFFVLASFTSHKGIFDDILTDGI